MALQKFDLLGLGRGPIGDNTNTAIVFSANNVVSIWNNIVNYAQYNVVEYSGKIYRSKIAGNVGLQPDTNPNQWEVMYLSPKDGDICFVVNGIDPALLQRIGGVWKTYRQPVAHLTLTEGASQADAFTFIGGSFYFSKLEYTIKRGSGQGRKRAGTIELMNDGSSNISYSHTFTEIGTDVDVWLTPTISAGTVTIKYDSGSEGNDIFMEYKLLGWE